MRWDRDYSSSNIDDRRGEGFSGGGGGGLPIGGLISLLGMFGWKGILVGLVLAVVLAGGGTCLSGNGLSCMGAGPDRTSVPSSSQPGDRSATSSPQEDELVHFVGFVFDDVQKMWRSQVEGYETTRLVLFRRGIRSGCGTATTAVGPFYCPIDHKVYIDLSFYDELRSRFGAPGDFAQAYVIAHELGHHIQNLSGRLGGGSSDSIKTELQADCLAGAWARDADRRQIVEVGDIDEALNAASQIGDDTLQKKSQGYVQPETWTHGSAAQRSSSFKRGYEGSAKACGL